MTMRLSDVDAFFRQLHTVQAQVSLANQDAMELCINQKALINRQHAKNANLEMQLKAMAVPDDFDTTGPRTPITIHKSSPPIKFVGDDVDTIPTIWKGELTASIVLTGEMGLLLNEHLKLCRRLNKIITAVAMEDEQIDLHQERLDELTEHDDKASYEQAIKDMKHRRDVVLKEVVYELMEGSTLMLNRFCYKIQKMLKANDFDIDDSGATFIEKLNSTQLPQYRASRADLEWNDTADHFGPIQKNYDGKPLFEAPHGGESGIWC